MTNTDNQSSPTSAMPVNAVRNLHLSEDEFIQRFQPIANPLDPNASFDFGEGGCLFAAVAEELDFLRCRSNGTVWTLSESDGHLEITDGMHYVNRLGYIFTEIACPPGTIVTVPLL